MGNIRTLDMQTANSIAAGEVVERPSSVVKELCENAMDAAATTISVEIRNGGISQITISDNGKGMDHDDALAAFGRHATSKLRSLSDLDSIGTMGFRGEALSSIAAVSRVTMRTRQAGSSSGTMVRIEGGKLVDHVLTGCPEGTTLSVESLFFNTPARYKFLKKDATEGGYIGDIIEKLALSRPDVAFRYVSNGQEIVRTPGNNDLMSAIYAIFGKQAASQCTPVEFRHESLLVTGYAGKPEFARNNRGRQILHVNGRTVQSRVFAAAIDEAYRNRLMKGKHPFILLRLEMPPNLLDVNVHPQKLEVRFWNESEVYLAFYRALKNAIEQVKEIPEDVSDEPAESERTIKIPVLPTPFRLEDLSSDPSPVVPVTVEEITVQESVPAYVDKTSPQALDDLPVAVVAETPAGYDVQKAFLAEARIVGSVFGTYILLEHHDDMILLDQHAAHERILFERLFERASDGEIFAQDLLVPIVMEITSREAQVLEEERQLLESLGFQYDAFGTKSVAIRTVPGHAGDIIPADAFRAALDDLMEDRLASSDNAKATLFASIACKASVKAGDRLGDIEIRALLERLAGLVNPFQCPHGRPVLFRITRKELEKRFRRIV